MSSSSMKALAVHSNAERAECTVPAPESGVVVRSAKESATSHELAVLRGYLLVDKRGEFLAWAEHIEVATRRSREIDGYHHVIRCSDNAVVAFAPDVFKPRRT